MGMFHFSLYTFVIRIPFFKGFTSEKCKVLLDELRMPLIVWKIIIVKHVLKQKSP
ncbi:hypothetical protein MTBBW1_1610034 [Desulfamplus magnetovallimortis]|uniref:Uncharacterized protein n=1 Tax=Desulfamplus magnetovallimortis TaxID=1246637 RepID=A0A1W1H8T4_9BACT|nr:hypothetical protein MTBBW1_1610034 [Desulfamplus magnetovallimortis]